MGLEDEDVQLLILDFFTSSNSCIHTRHLHYCTIFHFVFLPGYIDQGGAQLFGGGGGGMNFMNMTALFGRGGGGGGGGNGVGIGGNVDNTPLRMRTASNDVAAVSTAGSSIHGSIG
jgi:hypothetical protein